MLKKALESAYQALKPSASLALPERWKMERAAGEGPEPENVNSHRPFLYRLPESCTPTDELCGYTMWHLLAAQMLSEELAVEFLLSASEQRTNVLIDDIRESMAVFPEWRAVEWVVHATYQRAGEWSWAGFRERSAWKDTLGICEMVGRPLVWIDHVDLRELHPVIRAAHAESCRRIGWN